MCAAIDEFDNCAIIDGGCNIECKKDNQCRYAEWVFSKSGKIC